jgi:hypothetical protein
MDNAADGKIFVAEYGKAAGVRLRKGWPMAKVANIGSNEIQPGRMDEAPPFSHGPGNPSDLPERPSRLAEARGFDTAWAQLALFGFTISACAAAAYYPLRSGLATPIALIPGCVLIVAAALFGPLMIPMRGRLAEVRTRASAMPLVTIGVLASVVLAFWVGRALLAVYVIISLGGFWRALALLRHGGGRSYVWLLASAPVFALYLFDVVHSLNYAGLYTPEQGMLGTLNHDTTFHAAVAFLIRNFGRPSIGLDGVLPLKYHFGSHIWFAALGVLTAADPASVYGAAVPIVNAPLLVVAVAISGAAIDGARKSAGSYIVIGVGLIILSDFIDPKSYYISESYTFALIVLLLALPVLAELAQIGQSMKSTVSNFAIAIAIVPLLALLKISVGFLWTAALVWLAIRRLGFSWRGVVIGGAALASLAMISSVAAPGRANFPGVSSALIIPFYYFRYFPYLSSFSSLLAPAVLLLSQTKRFGGEGLHAAFVHRSDVMLEVTIVVTLLGLAPPLLGIPQDSSVYYFLNVGQWFAMGVLTARLSPNLLWSAIGAVRAGPAFALFVVFAALQWALYPAVYQTMSDLAIAADRKVDGKLLDGRSTTTYFLDTLRREHVLWGSDFRAALAASAGAGIIQAVRAAAPAPQRDLAIFIPPSNADYWNLHKTCNDKHNVQVALTGQPSLLGGPPSSSGCPIDAHTAVYGASFMSRVVTDADLCAHARDRGMRRVFVLEESRPSPQNRILDCKAEGGGGTGDGG